LPSRETKKISVKDIYHKEIGDIDLTTAKPYKNGFIFLADKVGIFTLTSDSASAQQVLPIPYHVTNFVMAGEKKMFLRLHFSFTNLSFYEEGGKWIRKATPLDSIEWQSIYLDKVDK